MRKIFISLAMTMVILACSVTAQAKTFTINYTAFDSVTNIYAVVDQGSIVDLSSMISGASDDWSTSSSLVADLADGSEYTFIFRIEDVEQTEEMGYIGLLADITGPNSFTVTSDAWRQATNQFMLYAQDATEWGTNGSVFSTSVDGIDITASWISNTGAPGDSGEHGAMYLGVTISDTPIPPAAWLMGSGLLGLLGVRLRRN